MDLDPPRHLWPVASMQVEGAKTGRRGYNRPRPPRALRALATAQGADHAGLRGAHSAAVCGWWCVAGPVAGTRTGTLRAKRLQKFKLASFLSLGGFRDGGHHFPQQLRTKCSEARTIYCRPITGQPRGRVAITIGHTRLRAGTNLEPKCVSGEKSAWTARVIVHPPQILNFLLPGRPPPPPEQCWVDKLAFALLGKNKNDTASPPSALFGGGGGGRPSPRTWKLVFEGSEGDKVPLMSSSVTFPSFRPLLPFLLSFLPPPPLPLSVHVPCLSVPCFSPAHLPQLALRRRRRRRFGPPGFAAGSILPKWLRKRPKVPPPQRNP